MNKRKNLPLLFLAFFKIGLFTFGGGYAMIALIEREFVENKKWISHDEFMDLLVIAESTPGPIAINTATYIGYKVGGFFGSLVSTVAICIPSVSIIYTISLFLDSFLENRIVAGAFKGIQACVVYLILSAGIKMYKKMKKSAFNVVMFSAAVLASLCISLFALNLSTIILILMGTIVGIITYLVGLCHKKFKDGKGGQNK